MNIEEAKRQIMRSVRIYLMKDEYGNYRIPLEHQRPVFLLGAPGIGKTAIMEQIAKELHISLVSYSMTHHTRQSALGLPFIVHTEYQGQAFDVSKYTMSEIIASVYENMEKSGGREGILFLDEINCVSETLGPSMLQFLQYKTFGNHRIPDGWVIVTAGNPPEFNSAVRDFDIATLDRLKVMEVEPDYEVWKKYGQKKGIHRSILTFLDIKREDFYDVENTVDGKSYVTARGWEDLSEAIYLYEEQKFPVDETLISQYIRNSRICEEFATYYELYNKYRTDYQVYDILHGRESREIRERAENASFDERITIMGLLLEALLPEIRDNVETETGLKDLLPQMRTIRDQAEGRSAEDIEALLQHLQDRNEEERAQAEAASGLTGEEQRRFSFRGEFLGEALQHIHVQMPSGGEAAFDIVRQDFQKRVQDMKAEAAGIQEELSNLFHFVEKHFGTGNEMLVLVTNLTVGKNSAAFIAEHGCEEYYRYNKKFMLYERGGELRKQLEEYR